MKHQIRVGIRVCLKNIYRAETASFGTHPAALFSAIFPIFHSKSGFGWNPKSAAFTTGNIFQTHPNLEILANRSSFDCRNFEKEALWGRGHCLLGHDSDHAKKALNGFSGGFLERWAPGLFISFERIDYFDPVTDANAKVVYWFNA